MIGKSGSVNGVWLLRDIWSNHLVAKEVSCPVDVWADTSSAQHVIVTRGLNISANVQYMALLERNSVFSTRQIE
jgi:hypothetical protein